MSMHNQTAPAADIQEQTTNEQTARSTTANPPKRDGMGRFLPGNPGGQGNPFGRTMASRRTAIMSAVGEEALMEIMLVMVSLAMQGDVGAAKLVFQYAVGKPLPMVDPDRIEIDEWNICKDSVVMSDDMKLVREGVTAKVANMLTIMIRVLNEDKNVDAIIKEVADMREERLAKQAAQTVGPVPSAARPPVEADGKDRTANASATPTPEPSRRPSIPPSPASMPTESPTPRRGVRPSKPPVARSKRIIARRTISTRAADWLDIVNRRPLDAATGDPAAAPSKCGSNGTHRPSKSRSNGQKRDSRKDSKKR